MRQDKITVPAHMDSYDAVVEMIENAVIGIDEKCQSEIFIAVEEILLNIINYANPRGEGEITISAAVCRDRFTVQFLDSGKPFNPLNSPPPDLSVPAEERDIGGLGIFMTKKLMDDMDYAYKGNKNILTLGKRLR